MDVLERAAEFEHRKHRFVTTSDRIIASREVKGLILEINDIYKSFIIDRFLNSLRASDSPTNYSYNSWI